MPRGVRAWRRVAVHAATLLVAACMSERTTAPGALGRLGELHLSADVAATTVATLVVRVSAIDIDPPLVFNLTLTNGIAAGVLHVPAGSARTIVVTAFDDNGRETHRGERTLDVQPGANNPTVSVILLPIAGSQPLEVWLGTFAISIDQPPASLQVDDSVTLTATVTMTTPGGPIPVPSAAIRWATATPATLAVDPEQGVAIGTFPGAGVVAATFSGVGALAHITIEPKLGYYASPTGTPGGDGSWAQPWDLVTALSGAGGRVGPGDVIWLRGGVYAGDFRSYLTGLPAQPIVVRQYRRERATIEGRLRVEGAYGTYWGFEIRQADPMAPAGPPALEAYAPGAKYINLIVHDAGENGISFRTPDGSSEIHGCILFNNGNTQKLDHGIYASSEATVIEKLISDNILFNNLASGIQVFGDETHLVIANVSVVGNIAFNNSSIAVDDPLTTRNERGAEENVVVGGDNNTVENITIRDNVLYFTPGISTGNNLVAGLEREIDDLPIRNVNVTIRGNYIVGGGTLFGFHEWEQAVVDGNTFVGEPTSNIVRMNTFFQPSLASVVWTNNVQYRDPDDKAWRYANVRHTWQEFKDATGLGATDQVTAAPLTTTKIVVRPNKYEAGRAHIAIHSPTGEANVSVDVSAILSVADRFEVRNVQDIFGEPVLSGVYQGGSISLPMSAMSPPPAVGRGTAPVTGPYFNAFVLTRVQP